MLDQYEPECTNEIRDVFIKKCFISEIHLIKIPHYSKSQNFVQKFNLDKIPNIFTSFSPKFFFLTIREIKVVNS